MKKRVHHAWFTIIEEDDATPVRLEDLRSNVENMLGHSPTAIEFHLEDVEHSEEPIDCEFESPCEQCLYGMCPDAYPNKKP